ncbi:MAG: hypothetical protein IKR61_08885 [Lachnospiraceae bacterium]|nr:hypothetical protein [Lachnospiraceae bacterium]
MLEELLRKEPAEVKKLRLSGKYGIQMTTDTKERVNTMCNLSEVILEKGIEQGIEKKMLEVIRNMIRHDYSDEQIMEVVDVPKDKVKLIREEMQQPV